VHSRKERIATKITIRDAVASDDTQIKEIIDLSFPRFYRFFASHSVSKPDEPLLVAEADSETAGFAKLTEFTVGQAKCGCILWIAVHPKYRRRGLALNLTNESVGCLRRRGASMVFASTQRTNKGALATLTKAGFDRVGFLGLWRLFGWRVFSFYGDIWFAPGEVVLLIDS
jgi:ribosomal protein S18 acetylase RimI-like enzyme